MGTNVVDPEFLATNRKILYLSDDGKIFFATQPITKKNIDDYEQTAPEPRLWSLLWSLLSSFFC